RRPRRRTAPARPGRRPGPRRRQRLRAGSLRASAGRRGRLRLRGGLRDQRQCEGHQGPSVRRRHPAAHGTDRPARLASGPGLRSDEVRRHRRKRPHDLEIQEARVNRAAAYAAQAPLMGVPGAAPPPGGAGEWFRGAGGLRRRAAFWTPSTMVAAQPRGTVVLSPGRTEPIEKYYEVIGNFLARGWCVLAHDWRGQGLSARLLPDRLKGHARAVEEFLDDYARLLDVYETRAPKPWIMVGHSMGGALNL